MKALKRLSAVVMILALVFSLAACNGNKVEEPSTEPYTFEEITSVTQYVSKVAALYGPFGMPSTLMKKDRSYAYDIKYYNKVTDVAADLKNGSAEIATMPLKDALELYNETSGKIRILFVSNTGFLYVLQKGDAVKSISDINGKKIVAAGAGTGNDKIINHIFNKAEVKPEVEYLDSYDKVIESGADYVMLPEPYASKLLFTNSEYSRAVNFAAEWKNIFGSNLAQACVVATQDYIDNHPEDLKNFMMFYEIAVNFMNDIDNRQHAISEPLVLDGFFNDQNLALKTVAGSGIVFIEGEEMKTIVNQNIAELLVLDPDLAGVTAPGDEIFYIY